MFIVKNAGKTIFYSNNSSVGDDSEKKNWTPRGAENSDEIDLLDLLKFAWRIRYFAIGGLFAGLLATLAYQNFFAQSRYISQVSVSIDPESLPAITDRKILLENFSAVLSSRDMASLFFQKVVPASQDFQANLQRHSYDMGRLAAEQAGVPADKSLVRVLAGPSPDTYIIEANLPVQGLGAQTGKILTSAINDLSSATNERRIELEKEKRDAILESASGSFQTAEETHNEKRRAYEKELAELRIELAQLEFRLLKQARGSGLDISRLQSESGQDEGGLRNNDLVSMLFAAVTLSGKNGTGTGSETLSSPLFKQTTQPALKDDRVIALLGALSEDERLKANEKKEIQSRLAEIQVRADRLATRFSADLASHGASLTTLIEATTQTSRSLNREALVLPLLKTQEEFIPEEVLSSMYERKTGQRRVIYVIGTLLGLFIGAVLGGIMVFIKDHKHRLKALFN